MNSHSIEPKRRIYLKGYRFLSFARNFSNKHGKKLLDIGPDVLKTAFKNVDELTS